MKQPQLSVDLAPHEQQLGKYRLVVKLGQGGMGTVYLALASGLGAFRKLLVVKELRHDLPWRESSLSMFMDEAQLAARLDHPNVLQTFEAGEADGRYFLAMEYLDGQPLSAIIDQGLPLELHVYILCEVLQGLQYAHDLTDYDGTRLHVVHRDVSPQNVFVTYHGQVKVVDFGVAKANNGSNITSPGVFKGKFAYAAPEQLLSRPVDGRCDVFAVGVMLWEAIAGRRFGVPKPTVDAFRVRTQGLEPRIAQVSADVDPLLAEICDHALAIDPLQRIESADAFRTRLQEWLHLQGEHIQTKQLAAHMSQRFSAERAERRRVIERAMIDAGASQSVIATLPRELYERESGMAAKVDAHSEHSNASGISPAPVAQAHADEPASTRSTMSAASGTAAQAQQLSSHTQGSGRLPEAPPAQVGQAKPAFRPSSIALLVCVAAAVFVATYQVSRRVTEAPSAPQLRAALPNETSTSSALRPTTPAAHSGDALPLTTEPAPTQQRNAEPPSSASDVSTKRTRESAPGSAEMARDPRAAAPRESPGAADSTKAVSRDQSERAAARDLPGADSHRAGHDPSDRAARRAAARDALTTSVTDTGKAARAQNEASPRTAAEVPAVTAAEVAGPASKLAGVRPVTVATEATPAHARPASERNDRATAPAAKSRASSSTRPDPSMGSDLRQLKSNGPMRIDVEDPYQ